MARFGKLRNNSVSSWSKAWRLPKASRACCCTPSIKPRIWSRISCGSSPSNSTSMAASASAGISRSKRTSLSRTRLKWRRSIRSHAAGRHGRINGNERAALSRLSYSSKTTPRCRGSALRGQRGLGDQAQSALGTNHHAGQIDRVLADTRRPGCIRSDSTGSGAAGCG